MERPSFVDGSVSPPAASAEHPALPAPGSRVRTALAGYIARSAATLFSTGGCVEKSPLMVPPMSLRGLAM